MIRSMLDRVRAELSVAGSARPLLYFRSAVALFCLLRVALLRESWLDLYGQYGFIQWTITRATLHASIPHLGDLARWLAPVSVSADRVLLFLLALEVCSLCAMLLGFVPRCAALLAWCGNLLLLHASEGLSYGMDFFAHIALSYCVILPKNLGTFTGPVVTGAHATIVRRMLQVQLSIVYCSSGIEKALGTQWWDGEAIWRSLTTPIFRTLDFSFLAAVQWVAAAIGWSVLVLEGLYPVFMFWRRSCSWWLAAVVGMHLGIGLFMGLRLFATIMIILNLAAFADDTWFSALARLLRRRPRSVRAQLPKDLPATP